MTMTFSRPYGQIRAEMELILSCLYPSIDLNLRNRIISLVKHNLNWEFLIETASRHRVLPLLYYQLNQICPEIVPVAILSQLRHAFQSNAQRNLLLSAKLMQLLKVFEEYDIAVISFKGIMLSKAAYPNLNLRHTGDLDLLINKKDYFIAKEILVSQGYYPCMDLSNLEEDVMLHTNDLGCGWEFTFVHEKLPVHVDLHWALTPEYFYFPVSVSDLLIHVKPVKLLDRAVPTFSPEYLLLTSCANASKDGWLWLKQICDIAYIIRNYSEREWEQVLAVANQLEVTRMLLVGVNLANTLLGVDIPEHVQKILQENMAVTNLTQQIQERCLGDEGGNRLSFYKTFILYLKIQERNHKPFLLLLRPIFRISPLEIAAIGLPKSLFFLYYPIRISRLIIKYSRKVLGLNKKKIC